MGSFLTIAFRFDIFITPKARVTVTTIGRPSGIAATAKLQRRSEDDNTGLLATRRKNTNLSQSCFTTRSYSDHVHTISAESENGEKAMQPFQHKLTDSNNQLNKSYC